MLFLIGIKFPSKKNELYVIMLYDSMRWLI